MPSTSPAALAALKRILPPERILTHPVDLMTYEIDGGMDRGAPDGVLFPASVAEAAAVVRWAREYRLKLVARGAGTGLSGGAVPEEGGWLVEFSKMNHILELDPVGRRARVEAGVITQALDERARVEGLYFPPDPSSGKSSTLGGNLAENAGGPHCFKYGVTANYVTSLEVVLADGSVLRAGGGALDAPEFHWAGLLTGSEGTLGLITGAEVRLIRRPAAVRTMMAAFDTLEAAGNAVSAVIAAGLTPATMELMDQKIMGILEDYAHAGLPVDAAAALIIEVDGYAAGLDSQMEEIAAIIEKHTPRPLRLAKNEAERADIWRARKSVGGAIIRLAPAYYPADCTVPRSRLAETLNRINQICDESGLQVYYVAHAGDGNLHPHILIPRLDSAEIMERVLAAGRAVMQTCVALGGSISGEHGIGIEKRDFMSLMFSADEMQAFTEIKQVFDPDQRFNPGKIFPAVMPVPSKILFSRTLPNRKLEPGGADEAAEMLRACQSTRHPAVIRGGGSRLRIGELDGVEISTRKLAGIGQYAPDDLFVTVGAGATLADLQSRLACDHYFVPLVSPWKESTLGGMLAGNLNAPLRLRYGAIQDQVLALKAVLPDGRVLRIGRPVVKNVAGYDLAKLFAGSYGILGLVTDVTLKLSPLPRRVASLVAPVETLAAGLRLGASLLPRCFVASALLLAPGTAAGVLSAPFALIYTAEGLAEEVEAELDEVRQALLETGAPAPIQVEGFSGSQAWADWLAAAPASDPLCQAGMPTARIGEALPRLPGGFRGIVDLANGLVYAHGEWLPALHLLSQNFGGYAVPMRKVKGLLPGSDRLARALKSCWDPAGVLNPGIME